MRTLLIFVSVCLASLPWLTSCETRSPKALNVGCTGGGKPDADGKCAASADSKAKDPPIDWGAGGTPTPTVTPTPTGGGGVVVPPGTNTTPPAQGNGEPEYLAANVLTLPVLSPDGHAVYMSLNAVNSKAALVAAFGAEVTAVGLTCSDVHLDAAGKLVAVVSGTWKVGTLTCTMTAQQVTMAGGAFTGDCR